MPTPKDVEFDDLVTLLGANGYELFSYDVSVNAIRTIRHSDYQKRVFSEERCTTPLFCRSKICQETRGVSLKNVFFKIHNNNILLSL